MDKSEFSFLKSCRFQQLHKENPESAGHGHGVKQGNGVHKDTDGGATAGLGPSAVPGAQPPMEPAQPPPQSSQQQSQQRTLHSAGVLSTTQAYDGSLVPCPEGLSTQNTPRPSSHHYGPPAQCPRGAPGTPSRIQHTKGLGELLLLSTAPPSCQEDKRRPHMYRPR